MRLTIFAATFAFLLWGAPAFAGSNPDFDNDGVGDVIDNCSETVNPVQDDKASGDEEVPRLNRPQRTLSGRSPVTRVRESA